MCDIDCNYATKIERKESIYTAKLNEDINVKTINAYGNNFSNEDELLELISNKYGEYHHHPLTGPIFIEGIYPKDILKVHINSISTLEMGQSLSRSAGVEPLDISEKKARCPVVSKLNINKKIINYTDNLKLFHRPMIGIIATTPEEGILKTGHARKKIGGNLDLPFISENTDIYIPVEIEGAGLYIGDTHAIEGYGELSGISLESSSIVNLNVDAIKTDYELNNIIIIGKEPIFNCEGIGIVGVGGKEDLISAIKDSYQGTCSILKKFFPELSIYMIKNIISLIGQSMNGLATAKTCESTSMIFIKKSDLEILLNRKLELKDLEKIIFGGELLNETNHKTRIR